MDGKSGKIPRILVVGGYCYHHLVVPLGPFYLTWEQLDIYGGIPFILNSLALLDLSGISLSHVRPASQVSSIDWILDVPVSRWWQLKYFLIFTPKLGEDFSNLTHIFSDGLVQPRKSGLFLASFGCIGT